MTDQTLSMLPVEGGALVAEAKAEHKPVKTFALFSGGRDSTVLLDWAWENSLVDAAFHINTGTAVKGVEEFCHDFCEKRGIPLIVKRTPWEEFRQMVLTHGFPGPSSHLYAYTRLKERRLDDLVRETKRDRMDRVGLVTGVRRYESGVRKMGRIKPVQRDGAQVWLAPLIDWTNARMRDYRTRYKVEQSDAAAFLCRSGECNCGAFADREKELAELHQFDPELYDRLMGLEFEAMAAGVERWRWGGRGVDERPDAMGPLCHGCQIRLEAA